MMKKFIYTLFAGSILLWGVSCEKNEETIKTKTQTTSTLQSLTELNESGIDIESLEFPESTTPSSDNSSAKNSAGLTFFSDPAVFAAACPDLPTEDFEEGNINAGGVTASPSPLDEYSDNAQFSPGDILPGVSFDVTGGSGFALLGDGFNGNTTKSIVANTFIYSFIINFTSGDVQGVSMDVQSHFGENAVNIEVFGSGGSLGTTTVAGTNAGTFWGVMADEPITQITLNSPSNQAEGIDNLSFGTCDSDGDGCPDNTDPHPNSILDATVVIDGCDSGVENVFPVDCSTMSDLIADCAAAAENHGDFVSCVAHLTNEWKAAGLISGKEKGAIQSCAAGANIPAE